MPILVITDAGHGPKAGRLDPGAQADLDRDGILQVDEQEQHLSRRYLAALKARLDTLAAFQTFAVPDSLDDPGYSDGHRLASDAAAAHGGPAVYLSGHLNALAGDRLVEHAIVAHYDRSADSAVLAEHLARGLARSCAGYVRSAQVLGVARNSAAAYQRRLHYCIRGVGVRQVDGRTVEVPNLRAVVLEPMDIRALAGTDANTERGLNCIADGLAHGLLAWAATLEDR